MDDKEICMIIGCASLLRDAGMSKEAVVPYYIKLLEHHKATTDEVNKNALRLALSGHFPKFNECKDHLIEVFPELEGQI